MPGAGGRSAGSVRLALPAAMPTASQLYAPRGVWLDDQRLIVCDTGNHRLLIWEGLPAEDHAAASIVLGQAGFEAEGPAASGRGPAGGLHLPTAAIVAEGRLLVADAWHHRVLVWHELPTRSDTPPDCCLGQPNLEAVEPNRGGEAAADSLRWPYGLAFIAGRLHVADTGNRRVLIWNGLPEDDRPADVVLGQDDFSAHEENRGGPPSASSFRWPHGIAGDRSWLFVADAGNHRVLGFPGQPTADMPATIVLGQADFDSNGEFPYRPQGPARLRFPYGLSRGENANGRFLVVADTANNRVLEWPLPPNVTAGSEARAVFGQPDFDAAGENHWKAVTSDSLCWPYGLHQHGDTLAIADSGNNRVMIWR